MLSPRGFSSIPGRSPATRSCKAAHPEHRKDSGVEKTKVATKDDLRCSGYDQCTATLEELKRQLKDAVDAHEKQKKVANTADAIATALRAVTMAVKADGQDYNRHPWSKPSLRGECATPSSTVNEDVESLFGAESTVSTACTSTTSEDGARCISPSLEDARRMLKEHVGAEERSMRFTHGLLAKLDEIRLTIDNKENNTCD
jgi:hypothetical protein